MDELLSQFAQRLMGTPNPTDLEMDLFHTLEVLLTPEPAAPPLPDLVEAACNDTYSLPYVQDA
jgi:hypothetical protein